jgi:hypothetical protein
MLIARYMGVASVVCGLSIGVSGAAFADVSIGTTGADSNQQVEFNNSSKVTVSNTNVVQVTNENVQVAKSGNVNADKNTSVGGLVSTGNASNANGTTTTVSVDNTAATQPVGGSGSEVGSENTSGAAGSAVTPPPGKGGSVLGASTAGGFGGGAVLPEVGASQFVDVSALRAAWQPKTSAPVATLAKKSEMFSGAMLLTAALLSLLGAIGSAWYARQGFTVRNIATRGSNGCGQSSR